VNVWDVETHRHPDFVIDFSNGDVAADSYHKYQEDIELVKDLGVGTHSLCHAHCNSWGRYSQCVSCTL
jgi:beta-glucosidase/6-phospho-beta-glucosidase/beta-galactosidase